MAEIVIVGPGSIEAMELGLRCVARGGNVVRFRTRMADATLPIFPDQLYFNEISIVPSYSCGPNDTREALRCIREGVVTSEKFITHRFPFSALHEAYRNAAAAQESIKTVVEFPG
jgi:L-iditol 2-dehydrogenase